MDFFSGWEHSQVWSREKRDLENRVLRGWRRIWGEAAQGVSGLEGQGRSGEEMKTARHG